MQNSKINKEKLERFLSQPIELQLELFKNYVEMVKPATAGQFFIRR
jgi:hypothetical protein